MFMNQASCSARGAALAVTTDIASEQCTKISASPRVAEHAQLLHINISLAFASISR